MTTPIHLGVVLAGGASRRMGHDKALLDFDGQRLVDRVVARVSPACQRVLIAAGRRPLADPAVPEITDAADVAGPLGGLLAALEFAHEIDPAALVAIVAVDLPFADAVLLTRLAGFVEPASGSGAAAPRSRGRVQPLHAVWRADRAGAVRAYAEDGGRRVTEAFDVVGGVAVDAPDATYAVNVNAPDDLRRALQVQERRDRT